MIDVSPYIDKLEMLREYMSFRISNDLKIWINIDGLPALSPSKLMDLVFETGIMLYDIPFAEPVEELSFNKWLESKAKYNE